MQLADTPKLTAILPYFGGKRSMAAEIVAEHGTFQTRSSYPGCLR